MANEAWPDIAGNIEDGVHRLPVRVYYEDTDFSGAVYHANYLKFCERGRSDCLRLLCWGGSRILVRGSDYILATAFELTSLKKLGTFC